MLRNYRHFRLTIDIVKESENLKAPPVIDSYRRPLVNDPSRQRPFNKESTMIVRLGDDRRRISNVTRERQIEGQREISEEKNRDFILISLSRILIIADIIWVD